MVSKSIVEIQQSSLFLGQWGKQTIMAVVCGGDLWLMMVGKLTSSRRKYQRTRLTLKSTVLIFIL